MSKYDDLMATQARKPRQADLGGWASLASAYRELSPNVSYAAFRARVASGKSVIEAGTMPRSPRGRKPLDRV